MPLFKGIVRITLYEYVPVFAKDEAAALAYLKSNADWREDSALDDYRGEDEECVLDGVEIVKNPAEVPVWNSKVLCWGAGDEEIDVAVAHYGDPEAPPEGSPESAWEQWDLENENIHKKWDKACGAMKVRPQGTATERLVAIFGVDIPK